MSPTFNYSGFVDMFLDSDDEFEPYGILSEPTDDLKVTEISQSSREFTVSSLYDT